MSKSRYIKDEIWSDEWFFELSNDEKLLWFFLLTNDRNNVAGVYKLSPAWVQAATKIEEETVRSIFERFERDKKIVRCSGWVVIVKAIKHQSINPSVEAGIRRVLAEVPANVCLHLVDTVTAWGEPGGSLGTACPTLLYLTSLNLASDDAQSDMSFKNMRRYKGEEGGYEEKAIDLDSGEPVVDKDEEARARERELMEWAEKFRGKKFLDRPTQLSFIKRLKGAGVIPATIKRTYMELIQSDYWQEQRRTNGQLPDFKTIFSNLKNKHD